MSIDQEVNENLRLIEKERSPVFVHIRRGDYLQKRMHDLGNICTIDYFHKAITYFQKEIINPSFYFFSDDINWVMQNFSDENFVFFNSSLNPVNDLYLMSRCRHGIISNSTYSWWGAWLISGKDKIIISPSKWNQKKPEEIDRIVPDDWIRLN
jgi:hypothetical protein